MIGVSVKRLELVAAGLLVVIVALHSWVAIVGFAAYRETGSLPDIRPPIFILLSGVLIVGLVAVARGHIRRDLAYSFGAALMIVQLVAYLDWHVLHVLERIIDLGELGHGHAHGTINRDVRTAVIASVADPWRFIAYGSSVSVILAALEHVIGSPTEFLAKSAELSLLIVLLLLRWAHQAGTTRLRWELQQSDVEWGLITGIAGFSIWSGVVGVGGIFLEFGAEPLFVHVLELATFVLLLICLGWFFIARPIVTATTGGEPPYLQSVIPGLEPSMPVRNVGFTLVYVIGFLAISATVVGFVPADSIGNDHHHHHHDHGDDDELDRFLDRLEDRGIDVDREWTMVHYSEYHGGDALLLDYHTRHQGDQAEVESELEEIIEVYVSAVEDDAFQEMAAFLPKARTPADDPYVRWEIDQRWIVEYLEGERSWDELLALVHETYDPRQ